MAFIKRIISVVLLVSLLFLASGCLFGGNKCVRVSGTEVDKNDLAKVKNGETSKSELISLFGAPTSTWASGDKKTEKLTYKHTKTTSDNTALLFIWAINHSNRETNTVVFTLKDGVVESYRKE